MGVSWRETYPASYVDQQVVHEKMERPKPYEAWAFLYEERGLDGSDDVTALRRHRCAKVGHKVKAQSLKVPD